MQYCENIYCFQVGHYGSKSASFIRLDLCCSYLFVCAFECEEHVAHVAWDEGHGGEGHAPADSLAPFWEHVVTHGKRDHLHCAEQEDSLQKEGAG